MSSSTLAVYTTTIPDVFKISIQGESINTRSIKWIDLIVCANPSISGIVVDTLYTKEYLLTTPGISTKFSQLLKTALVLSS